MLTLRNLFATALLPATRHARHVSCNAPEAAAVTLFFSRPVRSLLQPSQRKLSLEVGRDPLCSVRQVLLERGMSQETLSSIRLQHGSRAIESDEDLRALLQLTSARGVVPELRVLPCSPELLAEPAPPPPPESRSVGAQQLLSFFVFAEQPHLEGEIPLLCLRLSALLQKLSARGTVYVAPEGINAQLSVPVTELGQLEAELCGIRQLEGVALNLGEVICEGEEAYRKLVVRPKPQALTDGLPSELDWQRAGTELAPSEWHAALRDMPDEALLIDCRNDYEHELGTFVGRGAEGKPRPAEQIGTEVFSQSWDALRHRLADVPRDRPLMTFCTGGIRCVKVNAFLEQELGFTHTMRLGDGINGYLRHVTSDPPEEGSLWEGHNFLFHKQGPQHDDDV